MIKLIEFKNFKILENSKLPLSQVNVLVGKNGTGKTTAMKGLCAAINQGYFDPKLIASQNTKLSQVAIRCLDESATINAWSPKENNKHFPVVKTVPKAAYYLLDPNAISQSIQSVELDPTVELQENGGNLACVLGRLERQNPEILSELSKQLNFIMPEFKEILPGSAMKSFALRKSKSKSNEAVTANALSQGTLLFLTILTLSYLPNLPDILCIENPDSNIHPWLLRHVQDALYRLSYPESCGRTGKAVQVVATTHSPYFLDLFQEHPEEVIIASRKEENVIFQRLSERFDINEILRETSLSDVWYAGVLEF